MTRIQSFEGINAYDISWFRGAVCLPGIGIFVNKKHYSARFLPYVLQHEYGHYLDYKNSKDLRPFPLLQFYFKIGLPSLINAATGFGGRHRTYWTEIRANRCAMAYFKDNLMPEYEKYFPVVS